MDELLIKAGAIIAVVIILTIGSCCMHMDYRISKAIEQGVDPVAANLAFGTTEYDTTKIVYMMSEKGEKNE